MNLKKGISDKDVEKIRQIIINSKDGYPFGKRVMIYLLQKSQNFTIPVGLAFHKYFSRKGREAAFSIHDIKATRWNLLGTKFGFNSCASTNVHNGKAFAYLTPEYHPNDERIKILKLDWKTINQIPLG